MPAAVVTGGEVPTASSSKPSFQCPHCDKEPYSNRQNMNRHVLTKNQIKIITTITNVTHVVKFSSLLKSL